MVNGYASYVLNNKASLITLVHNFIAAFNKLEKIPVRNLFLIAF